jgi:DNA-binding protein H-NS
MTTINFDYMSIDELWALHGEIGEKLAARLEREKRHLEAQLAKLKHREFTPPSVKGPQRPYPKVQPKFQNPNEPSQTWAGRGRMPRWVKELLAAGKNIDELRIPDRGRTAALTRRA